MSEKEYNKYRALNLVNEIRGFNKELCHISDVISATHDVIDQIENKMAAFDLLMELAIHFATGLKMTKGEFAHEVEWFVDGYPAGVANE